MWRMLARRSTDLTLTVRDIAADEQAGKAHWEVIYTFSQTARRVHNKIDAAFRFRDGKIVMHTDTFNLWRWASMALGPRGTLLGWTPSGERTCAGAIAARSRSSIFSGWRRWDRLRPKSAASTGSARGHTTGSLPADEFNLRAACCPQIPSPST
jgi:SnoaL-like domain